MGSVFTRSKPTTVEILEKLDTEIDELEDQQRYTNLRRKHCVGYLLFCSVGAYILCALLGYIYFYPETHMDLFLRILPLLAFPFFIWILKVAVTWIFSTQLENNEKTLNDLRKKRRKILDEVMDTETYKVAREILERFDPEEKRQRSIQMFQRTQRRQTFGGLATPDPAGLRHRLRQAAPPPQHSIAAASSTPLRSTPVVGRSSGQRAVVRLQPPAGVGTHRDVPPDPKQTIAHQEEIEDPPGNIGSSVVPTISGVTGTGSPLAGSSAADGSTIRSGQASPNSATRNSQPVYNDSGVISTPYPLSRSSVNDQGAQSTSATGDMVALPPYSNRPVRPILPKERSTIDKMVDYFLGDGPNNRLALICSQCKSHNGMALAEEYPFIAYRCCYCAHFNPARKQRPHAPGLNDPDPTRQDSMGYDSFGSVGDLARSARMGAYGSNLSLNESLLTTRHEDSDKPIRATQITLTRPSRIRLSGSAASIGEDIDEVTQDEEESGRGDETPSIDLVHGGVISGDSLDGDRSAVGVGLDTLTSDSIVNSDRSGKKTISKSIHGPPAIDIKDLNGDSIDNVDTGCPAGVSDSPRSQAETSPPNSGKGSSV